MGNSESSPNSEISIPERVRATHSDHHHRAEHATRSALDAPVGVEGRFREFVDWMEVSDTLRSILFSFNIGHKEEVVNRLGTHIKFNLSDPEFWIQTLDKHIEGNIMDKGDPSQDLLADLEDLLDVVVICHNDWIDHFCQVQGIFTLSQIISKGCEASRQFADGSFEHEISSDEEVMFFGSENVIHDKTPEFASTKTPIERLENVVSVILDIFKTMLIRRKTDTGIMLSEFPRLVSQVLELTTLTCFDLQHSALSLLTSMCLSSPYSAFSPLLNKDTLVNTLLVDYDDALDLAYEGMMLITTLVQSCPSLDARLSLRLDLEEAGLSLAIMDVRMWWECAQEENPELVSSSSSLLDDVTNMLRLIRKYESWRLEDLEALLHPNFDEIDTTTVFSVTRNRMHDAGLKNEFHSLLTIISRCAYDPSDVKFLIRILEPVFNKMGISYVLKAKEEPVPTFIRIRDQSIEAKKASLELRDSSPVSIATNMNTVRKPDNNLPAPPLAPPVPPSRYDLGLSSKTPGSLKLRTVHWEPIASTQVSGSIWESMDWNSLAIEFDRQELESVFAIRTLKHNVDLKVNSNPLSHILDEKHQRQIDLVVSRLKLNPAQIRVHLENGTLSIDAVRSINACLPSDEDLAKVTATANKKGFDLHLLSTADSLAYELLKVPRIKERMTSWLSTESIPEMFADLYADLSRVQSFMCRLRQNQRLADILETFLALGNVLNRAGAKGNARGFSLESLDMILNVKSNDGKVSLLEYTESWLHQTLPQCVPEFLGDFRDIEEVVRIAQQPLELYLEEYTSSLKQLQGYCKFMKKSKEKSDFARDLCGFNDEAVEFWSELNRLFKDVSVIHASLKVYFAIPEETNWEVVFGMILKLYMSLKRTFEARVKSQEVCEVERKRNDVRTRLRAERKKRRRKLKVSNFEFEFNDDTVDHIARVNPSEGSSSSTGISWNRATLSRHPRSSSEKRLFAGHG